MFIVYTGLRGSGKSYYATAQIEKALLAGRTVWANYHLDFSRNPKRVPTDRCFFAPDIDDLAYMRDGLFVVDEAHWLLSSRSWSKLKPETHQYLAQSRKIGMDVILVTQSFARLDTIARELTEFVREFLNVGRGIHVWREYIPDDVDKATRRNVGMGAFIRRKRIEQSYDTEQLFGDLLKQLPPRTFLSNGNGTPAR